MSWKYVMFQDRHGRQFPVIFPQELVHAEMAKIVPHAYRSGELADGKREWDCPKAVSAGFVEGMAVCIAMGESESMGVKSRPEDTQIINNHPYEKGIVTPMSNLTESLILQKTIELLAFRKQEIGG